jgi:hypothetical protein
MSEFIEQFICDLLRQQQQDVDQVKRYYELIGELNYKINERAAIINHISKGFKPSEKS